MTRHEIATLACRILALWLFTQVAITGSSIILLLILAIVQLLSHGGSYGWSDFFVASTTGIPSIITLVGGILLWKKAPAFAHHMVNDDVSLVTSKGLDAQAVISWSCMIIGIWLIEPILRDLVRMCVEVIKSYQYTFSDYWHSAQWQADFWSNIVGLLICGWLILGSRGIVRTLWLLRYPRVLQLPPENVDRAD